MTQPQSITLDMLLASISGGTGMDKAASADVQPTAVATTQGVDSGMEAFEQLLTKSAGINTSLNTDEETSDMNKQAQAQGKAIADALIANLVKQANAVAEDSTQMVMEQMSQQAPTPREGLDVTNTLKALLLNGVQNGAGTNELSEMVGPGEEAVQGAVAGKTPTTPPAQPNGTAMGSVGESEEQEKAAAVYTLCSYGMDFDEAYGRVKQAEEELAVETIGMAKMAAAQDLIAAGVDFSTAVHLVEGSAAQLGL
jgi:hypothetical protein